MVKSTNLIKIDGKLIHPFDMTYYLSGMWKCDMSPTQAHWWVGNDGTFICKYCGNIKPIIEEKLRRKYGK